MNSIKLVTNLALLGALIFSGLSTPTLAQSPRHTPGDRCGEGVYDDSGRTCYSLDAMRQARYDVCLSEACQRGLAALEKDLDTAPASAVSEPVRVAEGEHFLGTTDIAKVRKFLKTYKGPVWMPQDSDGPINSQYMDKPAPSTAVPCKPPGYDHIVLCNKRGG